MKSISFSSDDGIFNGDITVEVKNQAMLKNLIDKLKTINGIDKVVRVWFLQINSLENLFISFNYNPKLNHSYPIFLCNAIV